MEFPGRLIAGFLVVVLLLIFPLQYIGGLNNDSIDALIDNRTQQFSDAIREKGYLDKQMYEEYVSFLDTTEEMYDIELRDIRPVKGEEYSLETNSRPIRTSSFKKLSHNEIQSYAAHTHTADCYADDLHVCNGTDCEYENDVQKILIGAGQRAYDNNLYMYYSYDGQTWNNFPNNSSAGYEFRKLTYMNGQFVIIGTWGHISVSSDGINWIDISSNFNVSGIPSDLTMRNDPFDIIDIVHVGNGVYYASSSAEKPTGYANPYSITKGVLLRSTDLINWEYVESFDQYIRGLSITKVGTKKILLGFSPGYYNSSFSYGRFNWEINENGTLANRTYSSLSDGENYSQAGDYTVAASSGRGYQVPGVYSTSYYSYFYSHRDYDFRYGNGIYLGFGSLENNYYTSVLIRGTSLSNMERVTNHNIDDISAVRNKMVFFDDRFIVAGSKETGPGSYSYYTYTSTDGISWTKRYAPVSFSHFACNAEGGSGEIDKGPCLKEGKYYDVNGVEIQPICNKVVSSIRAKHPAQTVKKGQAINTTAIATYLDGHEGEVNCTSNFIANQIGNQTVTLTYSGLVGNAKTAGTRTCTVNITVIPIRKLTSIAVFPEYQDIQRYSLPALTVRANYDDGTSKLLNSLEYNISGFNDANIALQSVVVTYAEGEITRSATVIVKVSALLKECPRCNQIYELNADDTDQGCPYCRELIIGIEVNPIYVEVTQGEELPITVKGIYNDGSSEEVTEWTSNYNPRRTGLQIVTVQQNGYTADITVWVKEGLIKCPICDTEYPASEERCPVCAEKVVRIAASPKEITVMQYETISLDVTAFYADGSSRIVDEWTIDRSTVAPGTYMATVSYRGVSDAITLTVLSISSIKCPICETIYNLSDSPKGCPMCSEEIIGVEAYLTSGSNMVQLGTTPAIAIILIFRDEHREFATEGYTLEDYNPQNLGVQTVRILYKGFTTSIVVELVNILDAITCPNGHVYHKKSDGTDLGCPFCHEEDEASNIAYFDITYTREILDTIYSIGVYYLQEGNYLTVIVTKKNKSLMYHLQKTFFSTSMLGRKKRFIYGGEVY